jgi:hypothetical protein
MAATGWLSLGPIGTGALGLLLLGAAAPRAFTAAGIQNVGEVAAGIGVIGGAMLWGYGAWWLFLAVMTTTHYVRQDMPFNLGWWGAAVLCEIRGNFCKVTHPVAARPGHHVRVITRAIIGTFIDYGRTESSRC